MGPTTLHKAQATGGAAGRKLSRLCAIADGSQHGSPGQQAFCKAISEYEADPVAYEAQAEAEEAVQLAAEKVNAAGFKISIVK
jgi:hypothetical protein